MSEGKVISKFKYADGCLKTRDGGGLKGFMMVGADQKLAKANANVVGDQVVVSSSEVKAPIAVCHAWTDNPECNLINSAGMPASPFRTDR